MVQTIKDPLMALSVIVYPLAAEYNHDATWCPLGARGEYDEDT